MSLIDGPQIGDRCTIEYHTYQWGALVEQGWVTMTVENGIAQMIYQPEPFSKVRYHG